MEDITEDKDKQVFWPKVRSQTYIISVSFGAAIIFLILFFVFPGIEEIKKDSEDLISGKNSLAFLGEQVNEVEKFKSNYENYKPNLEKIDQLYVDSKNPADFFKFLEKTASDCQVTSKVSLSPGSSGPENISSIDLQISSRGEFLKIVKFLEKLETGPYLLEIQNLSIKNSVKNNTLKNPAAETVDANFLIKVYIRSS